MSVSVLSNLQRSDFTRARLLSRIIDAQQAKSQKVVRNISDSYQTKINSITREQNRYRDLKKGIDTAATQINTNLSRVRSIQSRIESMILTVNKASQQTDPNTNYGGYASTFNSVLKGIDGTAKKGKSPNLLGFSDLRLTYKTGLNGSTASVQGAYLGSDYSILESTGKYWALNRDAKNIKRYDSYPNTPTNTVGVLKGGVRLDSQSGDAITFTIAPNTATPEQFSGTLTRRGLKVMDSWYYNDLATQTDRDAALADLKSAQVALKLEVSRYEVAASVSSFYADRAYSEIKGLRTESNGQLIKQAQSIKKAQDKLSFEFQITQSTVAQSLAMKNQYASMLSPFIKSPLARALIDITT